MDKCPLKPMPEKIDIPDFDDNIKAKNENAEEVGMYMYDRGHYRGYNLCIDKILGKRLDCSLYEDYCDLPQEIINEICKPFISAEKISNYKTEIITEMRKMEATDEEIALLRDEMIINAIRNGRKPADVTWAVL